MVLGAVLCHDHIAHASRFYMPRRRPLETNWRQELRRWALHLLVLPPEQAKPWPRCVQRFVNPLFLRLARQLKVWIPRNMRTRALGRALLAPARAAPSATSGQWYSRILTQRWSR